MVVHAEPNTVGERLREETFAGEGYGCYSTFELRDDARIWTADEQRRFWLDVDRIAREDPEELELMVEAGQGCTFSLEGLTVEAGWWWEGDGTLCFRITDQDGQVLRRIINTDCKKSYDWQELDPVDCEHRWQRHENVWAPEEDHDAAGNPLWECRLCKSFVYAADKQDASERVLAGKTC